MRQGSQTLTWIKEGVVEWTAYEISRSVHKTLTEAHKNKKRHIFNKMTRSISTQGFGRAGSRSVHSKRPDSGAGLGSAGECYSMSMLYATGQGMCVSIFEWDIMT